MTLRFRMSDTLRHGTGLKYAVTWPAGMLAPFTGKTTE